MLTELPLHVDDWLDSPTRLGDDTGELYAKFVLDWCRMPAWKKQAYARWMGQHKLFCTHNGERYRCTGASRMGDVWLTKNFEQAEGYQLRVCVAECTEWHDAPEVPN